MSAPIVVQLRGTSGSGKSTAMRTVMDSAQWNSVIVSGRKKPLYYTSTEPGMPTTAVLGHYESPCGGCDTIGSARAVYDLIIKIDTLTPDVRVILCEGLLLSEDVKWTTLLKSSGFDVRCLFLVTPVEQCIDWIKGRRKAAGNEKPLSESNTRNRVGVIERARTKLEAAGVKCRRCSARQAPGIVLNWLRLHAQPGGKNGPGTVVGNHAIRR